jgi:hypothetical protein
LLSWIGNAAAALFGRHGAVTQQAQQAGCSRQTVYDHAAKVQHAVAQAQAPGPSREALLREVEQLRAENRQLWDWLQEALEPPRSKLRQFAVAAAAMGLSLQQTRSLLAILLPKSCCPGRATLGRWVQAAARQAGSVLAALDRACRGLVRTLCLDEIFLRRRPVLMGVEPHSLAWLLGARAGDRTGETWAAALAAWPKLQDVAVDGGSGLARGLKLVARQRQRAAPTPAAALPLRVRLDVWHTRREGGRTLRHVWQQAEVHWQAAEQVERAKARLGRRGADCRGSNRRLACLWRRATAAFEAAERQQQAWRRAEAALAVFRPDGTLNEPVTARAELRAAAEGLPGPRWAKTRRLLLDERSLSFLEQLHQDLAAAEPRPEVRAELVACWRGCQPQRTPAGAARVATEVVQAVLASAPRRQWGAEGEQAYRRVAQVLDGVVRASSSVECVNSVVRMHQARHRKLTQPLLDLKRLYWNGRAFLAGKRRKRCPYEHLGLVLPSYDPWTLLQMDPRDLEHHLSTPGLAA